MTKYILLILGLLTAQYICAQSTHPKQDTVRFTKGFLKSGTFTYFNTQKEAKNTVTQHPNIAVKLPGSNTLYEVLKFNFITSIYDSTQHIPYTEYLERISGDVVPPQFVKKLAANKNATGISFSNIHFAYGDSIGILNYIGVTFTKE